MFVHVQKTALLNFCTPPGFRHKLEACDTLVGYSFPEITLNIFQI